MFLIKDLNIKSLATTKKMEENRISNLWREGNLLYLKVTDITRPGYMEHLFYNMPLSKC